MRGTIIILLTASLVGCQGTAVKKITLDTQEDRVSYAIGMDIGNNFKAQGIEIKSEVLAQGVRDALEDTEPMLTPEEVQETMEAFQSEMESKLQKRGEELGGKNKLEGEEFLAANMEKEGVVVLKSGLQYKVLTKGSGKTPGLDDTVVTHYRGTLINGEEFDSSYKRGQPATFPVSGVISGWTEALQLMKEGDKWQLFIPSDLAYGPRGAGGQIGPDATLIFDIELIEVK